MVLRVGIAYGKLLYCHGVEEGNVDNKISTLEYNNRTVYDCFNNPFTYDFGSPTMHIPPINIDDRPPPPCIEDPNITHICSPLQYISTLNTPYDSQDILPTDDPNTLHIMKKYVPLKGRVNIGYYYRKHV